MVERLLEVRPAFIRALPDMEKLPVNSLNSNEWAMAPDLIKLLQPLEALTRNLCGTKYATASMVIPCVGATIEYTKELVVECRDMLSFRAILVQKLRDRFLNIETNPILGIATLLDPRFKESGF